MQRANLEILKYIFMHFFFCIKLFGLSEEFTGDMIVDEYLNLFCQILQNLSGNPCLKLLDDNALFNRKYNIKQGRIVNRRGRADILTNLK